MTARRVFLGVMTLVCLLPLMWALLASLNIQPINLTERPDWLTTPTLDNYAEITLTMPLFPQAWLTGVALAAGTTLLTMGVAFLAAYSLARSTFRGRDLLVQSLLILASLPVIAYALPLRELMIAAHIFDAFPGVLLAETALHAPLATYVLVGYLSAVPVELEEAAKLDGASLSTILLRVVLPAAASGTAATAVIVFVLSWNQFLLPALLTATRTRLVTVMMRDFFTYEREFEWTTAAAVLILSLLPLGVFVALAHRLLERFRLQPTGE